MVIFRENTEGLYCGVEYRPVPPNLRNVLQEHPHMQRFVDVQSEDMAISCRVVTRRAVQAITRKAFDYAVTHERNSITIVEKPNVLRETSGLMVEEARKIVTEYPAIVLRETNIDAACMWMVRSPEVFDVILTSNLFGDILSDLAAGLVGGLGFAPSGNIGDTYALFEPSHGSAPKYAGLYKVNPIAAILSAKMMLEYLGEFDMANRLERSVARVIEEGKVTTYDCGGTSTTIEVAQEIARNIDTY
jgi:3-isopropylmalate dehydrogenase